MNRIVISGTYCTGKTTLSLALEKASGISSTHALTMREILPNLFPGKTLKDCSYTELICLGMKRFEDRIRKESELGNSFISDGCPLQEWLYGSTRLVTGAYPDEYPYKMFFKKLFHYRSYKDFKKLLNGFETMAKVYTQKNYDMFFHLPVEFPFVADGHRPTSEIFRTTSEKRLLKAYKAIRIEPVFITGNIEERLNKILNILEIEPKYEISECIRFAEDYRTHIFDNIHLELQR
ncbi:ATP/GTP-binding protein [Sphingobacterium composti Ten et al. 2007 non Yoo et al. 2007]|uniref:ATP/GTP-binding protein n=1 Tax=Sphingobacterium composti TaxID=363260 RepID=UPI001357342F|nr:ATP-binding protein [Sphingobacterium composti Ten et al. 2007 non Yoo et al. 2007]